MHKEKSLIRGFSFSITILLCVILSILITSCDKSEKTAQNSRDRGAVIGPIIDPNLSGGVMERLDMDSQSPESLALLGDKYFESGDFTQAIDIYRKVLELNPKDVDTHNDLGLSLYYTNRSNEALDILRKGTQLDPNYQNIWLSLGFVLTKTARNDEAITVLQKTADINPDTPQGQEAKNLLQLLK